MVVYYFFWTMAVRHSEYLSSGSITLIQAVVVSLLLNLSFQKYLCVLKLMEEIE
jgi:hypothetical protein